LRKKRILIIAAIVLVTIVCWIAYDNNHLVTTEYTVKSSGIDKELVIAQISDYHNCKKFEDRIIHVLTQKKPNYIALTGDLIDGNKTDLQSAISLAKKLTEIAPTFYVTGNHEAGDTGAKLKEDLEGLGVKVLSNKGVSLPGDVSIYGIDDPLLNRDTDADSVGIIKRTLADLTVDESNFNILLSHRPEAYQAYIEREYDIVLTGHAHGGQFRLPFVGGVIAPDQGIFPKYDSGKFEENGTTMIVNRGIGNSIIPFRINNPPELVFIKIS